MESLWRGGAHRPALAFGIGVRPTPSAPTRWPSPRLPIPTRATPTCPRRSCSYSASNGVLKLPDQSSFGSSLLEFLAYNPDGPAGILPPGASGSVQVDVQNTSSASGTTGITVYNEGAYDAGNDLVGQASVFQLPGIPTAAWNAIYANFLARAAARPRRSRTCSIKTPPT